MSEASHNWLERMGPLTVADGVKLLKEKRAKLQEDENDFVQMDVAMLQYWTQHNS